MPLSVIIPVLDSASFLHRCLESLRRSSVQPAECVVVDDGSIDRSGQVAESMGAVVIHTAGRAGPAVARNLGAVRASSDVLVFVDADVCVHSDTLFRIQTRFETEPDLHALIGSYDDSPDSPDFVSQYKNLLNHYFHQCGNQDSIAFWSACGAIRRDVFLAEGGFDESYSRPSIEDIELGYRLRKAGRRIALDRTIQVKHLKRWRLAQLLRCDIFERALPWTRLILESGRLPDDLNLAVRQRIAVLLVWASAALGAAGFETRALLVPAALAAFGALWLNRRFFGLVAARRGWTFAAAAFLFYLAYCFYSSLAFAAGVLLFLPGWSRRLRVRKANATAADSSSEAPHSKNTDCRPVVEGPHLFTGTARGRANSGRTKLACLVYAAGATLAVLAWQATTVHFNYGGNWTGLFCTGDYFPAPPELAAGTLFSPPRPASTGNSIAMWRTIPGFISAGPAITMPPFFATRGFWFPHSPGSWRSGRRPHRCRLYRSDCAFGFPGRLLARPLDSPARPKPCLGPGFSGYAGNAGFDRPSHD